MRQNKIFVFGSNLAGIHGAGSALAARKNHDAETGIGVGLTGDAYAIPTKDGKLEVMPLSAIQLYVEQFLQYAWYVYNIEHDIDTGKPINQQVTVWNVVDIGCGLAGYKPEDIAPMFADHPPTVLLSEAFLNVINKQKGVA